jgi:hypothetical protein
VNGHYRQREVRVPVRTNQPLSDWLGGTVPVAPPWTGRGVSMTPLPTGRLFQWFAYMYSSIVTIDPSRDRWVVGQHAVSVLPRLDAVLAGCLPSRNVSTGDHCTQHRGWYHPLLSSLSATGGETVSCLLLGQSSVWSVVMALLFTETRIAIPDQPRLLGRSSTTGLGDRMVPVWGAADSCRHPWTTGHPCQCLFA